MKTSIFKLSSLLLLLLLGVGTSAGITVQTGNYTTLTFQVNTADTNTVRLIKTECGAWSGYEGHSAFLYDEVTEIPATIVVNGVEKTVTEIGDNNTSHKPVFQNCVLVKFPSTIKKIGKYGLTYKHVDYGNNPGLVGIENVFDFSEAESLEIIECDFANLSTPGTPYSIRNLTVRGQMNLGDNFPYRFSRNLQYDVSSTVYDLQGGCLMKKGDNETVQTILRLPEVTVPATVKRIAHSMPCYDGEEKTHIAFEPGCQLETISGRLDYCVLSELPQSLKACVPNGGAAFEYSEFEQFTLPADLSGFGNGIFNEVTFNDFDWGENPELRERLFSNCTFNEDLTLPEGMTSTNKAFPGVTFKGALNLPESFTTVNDGEFNYCTFMKELKLPEGMTEMPTNGFSYCTFHKRLVLPESVRTIKARSFEYCSLLSPLELPEGLETIEADAFRNLNFNNGTLVMPAGVTVDKDAFVGCQIYKMVWTGETFDGLGSMAPGEAFSQWRYLNCQYTISIIDLGTSTPSKHALTYFPRQAKIYTHCKTPPAVTSLIYQQGPIETEYRATLYVPRGCKEIYSNTSPWRYYPNIVEFDETQQCPFVGDLNGDGKVNVSDITTLINHILDTSGQNAILDDVNEDSKVNVSDVTCDINKILGIK